MATYARDRLSGVGPNAPVHPRTRPARSVASIGHTKATAEQIERAIDAGATMSTHLGNAAHPTLPKTQNYIGISWRGPAHG